MNELPLKITIGLVSRGVKVRSHHQIADNKPIDWDKFAGSLNNPKVGPKDGSYLLRGPCYGPRNTDHMNSSQLLVIDGDSSFDPVSGEIDQQSAPPALRAHEALKTLGLTHVIHTSHSHMQNGKGDRWRAYIPTDREYTKPEIGTLTTALHKATQEAGCPVQQSTESSTFAQAWYLPRRASESAAFEHYAFEGLPFAVDAALTAPSSTGIQTSLPNNGPTATLQVSPIDLEKAQQALHCISPDCIYPEWINTGMALHSTGAPEAFTIWHEWSSTGGKYQGIKECRYKWDSFSNKVSGGLKLNSLFFIAREYGWVDDQSTNRVCTLTDSGNSIRLLRSLDGNGRYCPEYKSWLIWNGKRWDWDDDGAIVRAAKQMARDIYAEAASEPNDTNRTHLAKHAKISENVNRLTAAEVLARSELPVHPCELDRDNMLFGVTNGTIDLRTGFLLVPSREHFITKMAPVDYTPRALAPKWNAFLKRVLPDEQLRNYVQRCVGYSLTGSVGEQCLFLCQGGGQNGKSVFRELLLALVGDYGSVLPVSALMTQTTNNASPEVAGLRGVRFSAASESEEHDRLAESQVKRLTGGDTLTARHLHKGYISFEPTHKLWLLTNHLPNIYGDDPAIWRRIRVIPFDVTIPDSERDNHLTGKLLKELPGILNWAIDGCRDWQQQGLTPPQSIIARTEAYRAEQDVLSNWLGERCELKPSSSCRLADLFHDYKCWAATEGFMPLGRKKFGQRLQDRGFQRIDDGNHRPEYHGIELISDFLDI